MRFRIHRGAKQIGGNCIEVESAGKSLLLDLGLPLEAVAADTGLLPPVSGLVDGNNPDLLGVVLSHPHGDHYGLLASTYPSLPVYLGEGASKLLLAAAHFTRLAFPQPVMSYRSGEPFAVGPFRVTPYLMDHSAFNAHALLVEADGRRLLYSGDFRAHGRKGRAFDAFLSRPPQRIDALLIEGTVIGREDGPKPTTEVELEDAITSSISNASGLVLACFSAQNVDRFVTFYKATQRAGRQFIADAYTATILDALALPSLPSPSSRSSRIRVFLPKRQKMRVVRAHKFDLVEPYRRCRIYPAEISASPDRWVMMFRSSMIEDIESIDALAGGRLIWSLWPGYLDRDKPDLRVWSKDRTMEFEVQHTSGHAHVSDLKRFVAAVGPRWVVPIHTRHPEQYAALYPSTKICGDGQWISLT